VQRKACTTTSTFMTCGRAALQVSSTPPMMTYEKRMWCLDDCGRWRGSCSWGLPSGHAGRHVRQLHSVMGLCCMFAFCCPAGPAAAVLHVRGCSRGRQWGRQGPLILEQQWQQPAAAVLLRSYCLDQVGAQSADPAAGRQQQQQQWRQPQQQGEQGDSPTQGDCLGN